MLSLLAVSASASLCDTFTDPATRLACEKLAASSMETATFHKRAAPAPGPGPAPGSEVIQDCADLAKSGVTGDGDYVVGPRGLYVFCHGMAFDSPKTYIDVDLAENYACYYASEDRYVCTYFYRLAFDPVTLTVDGSDYTYSTSYATGPVFYQNSDTPVSFVPYGTAIDCLGPHDFADRELLGVSFGDLGDYAQLEFDDVAYLFGERANGTFEFSGPLGSATQFAGRGGGDCGGVSLHEGSSFPINFAGEGKFDIQLRIRSTPAPTAMPTLNPTAQPTTNPTATPTTNPTANPTAGPTANPTAGPTANPTVNPTPGPTVGPSPGPTPFPTPVPTTEPVGSGACCSFNNPGTCSDVSAISGCSGTTVTFVQGASCADISASTASSCSNYSPATPSPTAATPSPTTPSPTSAPASFGACCVESMSGIACIDNIARDVCEDEDSVNTHTFVEGVTCPAAAGVCPVVACCTTSSCAEVTADQCEEASETINGPCRKSVGQCPDESTGACCVEGDSGVSCIDGVDRALCEDEASVNVHTFVAGVSCVSASECPVVACCEAGACFTIDADSCADADQTVNGECAASRGVCPVPSVV